MGLGDMIGKVTGMLGGGGAGDIMGKIQELGIDPSDVAGLDVEGFKGMLADKGIDLSMLEGMGVSVEDVLAKLKGG